ncbi:Hermansky-Pudlak syndrome 4 protein [Xyrichtys novacula]|uniref:Hermansky-Pudlak syndrome 4 protein n=1 Tax=Xyrichtys novacula TaxID=13765 RepID=A0AAV1G617_XYRNO|nr:Hermansky-Pudlak syndrome 4 protein [Xyrichtys novacula]
MAELMPSDSRRCTYFFLYDGSKVKGEGDPTRQGICYFYPEETSLDKQELLCGQLAGVGRCVSELSFSPVRILRLRRNKFAIRMKDDFFWALGCSVEVPTVSVCELLDQLINLFCFYNGSVRRSYQLNSRGALAARWAQYLSHLQSGCSELHYIFSCLKTLDSTNVDPLLLLKAALILQACQRCPLVLAGCILFRGRVVSTQMSPQLTMKVMVQENETYNKAQRLNGERTSSPFGGDVCYTTVYLTMSELQFLQSVPADKDFSSHSTPHKDTPPTRTRLSRTLSDMSESENSDPGCSQSYLKVSFSPHLSDCSVFSPSTSQSTGDPASPPPQLLESSLSNGNPSDEAEELEEEEEALEVSYYHSFNSNEGGGGQKHQEGDNSVSEESPRLNGGREDGDAAGGAAFDFRGAECGHEGASRGGSPQDHKAEMSGPSPSSSSFDKSEDSPLIPMMLYLHRVKGLVLALLAEPHFLSDSSSMEEVYHSSLASLNGLEAHLRNVSPVVPGAPGPYVFAHFDCIQSTLTANLSGRPGGAPERPFVRATSLLHSHFYNTETLQEAIIRSAGAAVYGTRSVAQETYFQQHGGSVRNSGIPNHQDSAFSLPSKARHRLLKHGVNLL